MEKVNILLLNFAKFYVNVKNFIFISSKAKWSGTLLCIVIELLLQCGKVNMFFFSSKQLAP